MRGCIQKELATESRIFFGGNEVNQGPSHWSTTSCISDNEPHSFKCFVFSFPVMALQYFKYLPEWAIQNSSSWILFSFFSLQCVFSWSRRKKKFERIKLILVNRDVEAVDFSTASTASVFASTSILQQILVAIPFFKIEAVNHFHISICKATTIWALPTQRVFWGFSYA